MKASSRSLPAAALLAALLAALVTGCEEPVAAGPEAAQEARAWPEGTVVAVDDVPIGADDVDAASVWVERIDPKSSAPQLRRLALTNHSLPLAIARAMAPEERERALAEAEAALVQLRAGNWSGAPGEEGELGELVQGTWQDLGIALWGSALDLPEGEWSGPVEEPGSFLVLRVLERADQPHTTAIEVRVDVLAFRFLDAEVDLEAAIDEHRLTIVDPAWRELVPELTQYRMGVHAP